jgi:ketosteroid isomerase-like protein
MTPIRSRIGGRVALALVALSVPLAPGLAQRGPRPLFDGRDLAGWHVDVPAMDTGKALPNPFIVRDGHLVTLGEPRGHLITNASYRDYRLEVEYRFPAAPGNAGVLVHASTPRALYAMFPKSIEVQMESGNAGDFWCIVEDIAVPDMIARRGARDTWGITEGKARRIVNLTDGSEKPLGDWNRMVIETVGRSLRVWVNGALVNDGFDMTADHGQIALQAEGAEVEFRRLDLTPIAALTPPSGAPATARADVRTARLAQNAAFAAGLFDSAATFWTNDVTITTSRGAVRRGVGEYRDALAGDSLRYERVPDRIDVSAAWAIAWEEGRWVGRRGGTGPAVVGGRYSAQWQKVGDRWKIRSELFVGLTCAGETCRRSMITP